MPVANPYELQRQRIKSDTQAEAQGQNEALKRRFARMGAMNSGAAVKAQERLSGQQEKNQQRALEGVDVQESIAAEQKAEAERGRSFSREERLGSQQFASGESALGRRFMAEEAEKGRGFSREERLGSQGFQEGILGKQQSFAKSEREAGQGFQARVIEDQQAFASGEREASQKFATGEREATALEQRRLLEDTQEFQQGQFREQMDLANEQFKLDKTVSDFNMNMATELMNKRDIFEKAMDPLGGKNSKKPFGKGTSTLDPVGITGGLFG